MRKITTSGIISTLAGNGVPGNVGNGGPSTLAQLYNPNGIALDMANNIYISEHGSHIIRIICKSSCLSYLNESSYQPDDLKLFPNPNNGTFQIKTGIASNSGAFQLLNSLGQIVCEQKITTETNYIKTNGLDTGLYFYKILQDNTTISKGKLVIE